MAAYSIYADQHLTLNTINSNKKYLYAFVVGLFVAAQIILYLFGKDFLQPAKNSIIETAVINPDCNLQKTPCEANFSENVKITFSLSPRPIKPLVPLNIDVSIEKLEIENVHVQFEGIDMYMGYYRPELSIRNKDNNKVNYEGNATLSVCTLDEMPWQANVILTTDQGIYVAPFQFVVSKS